MQDSLHLLNTEKIVSCELHGEEDSDLSAYPPQTDIVSLQSSETGGFAGDEWGEIASRFSYCAVSALSLLGRLDALDLPKTIDFLRRCKNFDGGFGMVPGAESHAAYGGSFFAVSPDEADHSPPQFGLVSARWPFSIAWTSSTRIRSAGGSVNDSYPLVD